MKKSKFSEQKIVSILNQCEDGAFKLLYLALMNITKKWSLPIQHWKQAMNHFALLFEDRMMPFTQIFG